MSSNLNLVYDADGKTFAIMTLSNEHECQFLVNGRCLNECRYIAHFEFDYDKRHCIGCNQFNTGGKEYIENLKRGIVACYDAEGNHIKTFIRD